MPTLETSGSSRPMILSPRTNARPSFRDFWISLLLVLATAHCVMSIFYDNTSFIDLTRYENGTAALPFQARLGMMPVLQWAHTSPAMGHLARWLFVEGHGSAHLIVEYGSPEVAACLLTSLISLMALVAAASFYGWKNYPDFWFLPGVLTLVIFYVCYAARSEQSLWYPYDLPHCLLFGLACFALLERRWALVLLLFVADLSMRETSIYLVPCVLGQGFRNRDQKKTIVIAACMIALWLPVELLIRRHFHANASDVSVHYHQAFHSIIDPKNWPQVLSFLGFFGIPLWMGRRHLEPNERTLLLCALPCVMFSALFGIWFETRVWSEWFTPAATLLATEAVAVAANLRVHEGRTGTR